MSTSHIAVLGPYVVLDVRQRNEKVIITKWVYQQERLALHN